MAIQVILELQAKPGDGERLAEVVRGMLDDTNRMDGALGSEVLRGLDDGDKVVLVEQWRDRADHEAYVRWREETGTGRAELAALLAAPPAFAYYDVVS